MVDFTLHNKHNILVFTSPTPNIMYHYQFYNTYTRESFMALFAFLLLMFLRVLRCFTLRVIVGGSVVGKVASIHDRKRGIRNLLDGNSDRYSSGDGRI